MSELRDVLLKFKEASINIYNCLRNDDFDKLEELLSLRQEVIDKISNLDYKQNEFREISIELGILKQEQELNILFNNKRMQIRKGFDNVSSNRFASKVYNKKQYTDSMFFNKKL